MSNENYAVKVYNATVRFNMASEKIDNLKEYFVKLVKRELMFKEFLALKDVSFEVKKGEAWGIIGTNGSGKSTTEKLICGHLVPNHGTIRLFDRPYTDPGVRVRVGALIENAGCFPGSSGYQNLTMQAINLNLPDPDR